MNGKLESCSVCGSSNFLNQEVIWPELKKDWELTPDQFAYINRQQGTHCSHCSNNLRSISLAAALLNYLNLNGNLAGNNAHLDKYSILEINRAGNVTPYLQDLPGHLLLEYPNIDMQNIGIEDSRFDIVLHSDTLEHIPDPHLGLSECRRILKPGGACIYTIPMVVERLTRPRVGLKKSYHGSDGETDESLLVWTEFGSDAWLYPIRAGFRKIEIFCLENPSAFAFTCIR